MADFLVHRVAVDAPRHRGPFGADLHLHLERLLLGDGVNLFTGNPACHRRAVFTEWPMDRAVAPCVSGFNSGRAAASGDVLLDAAALYCWSDIRGGEVMMRRAERAGQLIAAHLTAELNDIAAMPLHDLRDRVVQHSGRRAIDFKRNATCKVDAAVIPPQSSKTGSKPDTQYCRALSEHDEGNRRPSDLTKCSGQTEIEKDLEMFVGSTLPLQKLRSSCAGWQQNRGMRLNSPGPAIILHKLRVS